MSAEEVHETTIVLKPRRLLRGETTYSAAKEQDASILHQLGYREQKIRFFTHLYRNRNLIRRIVSHNLGINSTEICNVVDVEDWIHGSFNVCIRVDIDGLKGRPGKLVMIRLPPPYRIVGTYACKNCPTLPIPHLYSFGLSNGKTARIELATELYRS
ncbi:hypothetical protein BDW69DRAFT_195865 [Aspergillus filifer]